MESRAMITGVRQCLDAQRRAVLGNEQQTVHARVPGVASNVSLQVLRRRVG